ncbi:response regulator [Geminicoccus sp.]|uniref:response regulator n=1 Tax=Geminicoccus sp. TaxID=2024832 RepID=UPI0039C8AEEE
MLPQADVPADAVAAIDPEAAELEQAAMVLVIDDDPDMRRILVEQLEALGYRVRQVADGPTGLTLAAEERPDAVILDFAMPDMNGAEVARILRERWRDLPIVFVSGYADTAAIESILGTSTPLLRKPFRVGELQAVLVEILNKQPSKPA